MNQCDRLIRRSVRLYGLILLLYPRRFRENFGCSMADTFERMLTEEINREGASAAIGVWKTVLAELLPTVVKAHLDEAISSRFPLPVRVGFAAILPLVAYGAAVRVSVTPGQVTVLTLWLFLLAGGVLLARGRGWRCSVNAGVASAVGILLPVLDDVLNGRMAPESYRAVPLLVITAAAIGFMYSVYVRVLIEGVQVRRAALA